MTDASPGGSPRPPESSSATAARKKRRKVRRKGSPRAAPAAAGTKEGGKLRELFLKALSQFPYRISPAVVRRLLTAVDLVEDRPADLSPFLGRVEALDTQLIEDKPLLRERTVELLFQLLTVLAICALAFAVGITIGSIVCRTTLFSGSAITGLYVDSPPTNWTTDFPPEWPQVTLLLPDANGWATAPTTTAVLIGRFSLSLPQYSLAAALLALVVALLRIWSCVGRYVIQLLLLSVYYFSPVPALRAAGSYVEALSAVLTLTYLPAVHIGRDAQTCFGNLQPPEPPYASPVSNKAFPSGSAPAGRRGRKPNGAGSNGAPSSPRQLAANFEGAAGAAAGRGPRAEAAAGGGMTGKPWAATSSWWDAARRQGRKPKPNEDVLSSKEEEDDLQVRGAAGAHAASPAAGGKGEGEAPRRLHATGGSSASQSPPHSDSSPSQFSPQAASSCFPLSISPVQRRWKARSSEFMHRFVAATAEHMRRRWRTCQGARPQGEEVDEEKLIEAAGGPGRGLDAAVAAKYALVRRAIESLSLLSRSSVSTRQPLRVPMFDPVTQRDQEQSLMLLRHSGAAGFPVGLLEDAAVKQGELRPTLLFRSILPFVVGLEHGLNKVHVTASINVPLVAENRQLLDALVEDCRLRRVYFSLEVTLQAVRAMFFKQTHGKRVLEPFRVLCSIQDVKDESNWPPAPPKSFVYDVAELALEYASLSVGFGSTP